ncbi:hypothetical protein GP486_005950 [Trichoglossum hirsutum]|uniref:C2H2-type domain-containing protein n=1 Tax=Trichoglossum hirsutum TaxID=265104 RepID=A0A9P8L894_9PEZI|nr:hypothetical protein GP486_005950 [Trichoglossum hirsutum]
MNPLSQSQFDGGSDGPWLASPDIDDFFGDAGLVHNLDPTNLNPYPYGGSPDDARDFQPADRSGLFMQARHAMPLQRHTVCGVRPVLRFAGRPYADIRPKNASSRSSTTYNPSNISSSSFFHHGSIQRGALSATNTTYEIPNEPHMASASCNPFARETTSYSIMVEPSCGTIYHDLNQQLLATSQRNGVIGQPSPPFGQALNPAMPGLPVYTPNQPGITGRTNGDSAAIFGVGPDGGLHGLQGDSDRPSVAPDGVLGVATVQMTSRKRVQRPDVGPKRDELESGRGAPRRRVDRPAEDCSEANLPTFARDLFRFWLRKKPGSFPNEKEMVGLQIVAHVPLERVKAYFEECRPQDLLGSRDQRIKAGLLSAVALAPNRITRCSATADQNQSKPRDDFRPYQCTSGCGEKFSKKDSWRKHEEISRPQNIWVCFLDKCEGKPIQKRTFYTKPHFKQHFNTTDHKVAEAEFEKYAKEWHAPIGGNFEKNCGFCGSPFRLWKERINHIAEHFTGNMAEGPLDMSQWQDPWRGREKSKLEEVPGSSSDSGDSSDESPDEPPPPDSHSGGGPDEPTGDPNTERDPDANQDGSQGRGRHSGQNTKDHRERQFGGRREAGQQRQHTETCFNHEAEVSRSGGEHPNREIDLSYIGAWAWDGPRAGRWDSPTTRRRSDPPSHLVEGGVADSEQGIARKASGALPEPGARILSLAERLPAMSAIVGAIAGVIDGQLKCSDVADVELRYRRDGARVLWRASLVGIYPSRNSASSSSSSSIEEWPDKWLKASPMHHRTKRHGKISLDLYERTQRLGVRSRYHSSYPTPSLTPGPSNSRSSTQQQQANLRTPKVRGLQRPDVGGRPRSGVKRNNGTICGHSIL